jgi:hypothetical protein
VLLILGSGEVSGLPFHGLRCFWYVSSVLPCVCECNILNCVMHAHHSSCILLFLVVALVSAQIPEPNCNSNRHEGVEVWSSVVNHIGQGAGAFWWVTWP